MQDFSSIRAFVALCHHQSLTAAAKALGQPKSTVSRRLAQLETDMGQSLTQRQGNRLVLTKAGEIFSHYCQQMLDLAEESEEAIQGLNNHLQGPIDVLCHPGMMRGWAGPSINAFLAQHPKVSITLTSEVSAPRIQSADLIIWAGDITLPMNCRADTLGQWQYGIYAAPHYVAQHGPFTHPRALDDHPWLDVFALRRKGLTLYNHDKAYHLSAIPSRFNCDMIAIQLDAIADGQGVGLLPTWSAAGYQQHHPDNIMRCLPQWHSAPVPLRLYCSAGRLPLRVESLKDWLQEAAPAHWQPARSPQAVT
ncbi:LysR family transcriptional regulator [Salinivibrio sp. EAGSL]|jgi:Transcriptional regulator|uniref:LysR family transcriptional regulator n=1 Tax=Salinivibrio sp. EAGSL TaxID=2738468 RepID=UPI00158A132B|nr:LysR family transcriptional regulator [Salinivibrio sp. EAGSL]NUY57511.1 LysR family transcriptional regulator [Salinivibrio sp. EAGSL]